MKQSLQHEVCPIQMGRITLRLIFLFFHEIVLEDSVPDFEYVWPLAMQILREYIDKKYT